MMSRDMKTTAPTVALATAPTGIVIEGEDGKEPLMGRVKVDEEVDVDVATEEEAFCREVVILNPIPFT
jgi:hypothetical protein